MLVMAYYPETDKQKALAVQMIWRHPHTWSPQTQRLNMCDWRSTRNRGFSVLNLKMNYKRKGESRSLVSCRRGERWISWVLERILSLSGPGRRQK